MQEKKQTICFISNYYKTYLFIEIAKQLIKNNVNVVWITVDKKYQTLLSEEFGKDKVLHISLLDSDPIDCFVDKYKLLELYYSDRVIREKGQKGLNYLKNISIKIYQFLKLNEVSRVFGEITWAHELIAQRICSHHKELNCIFLNPHTIRKPFDRFAFFSDESQSVFFGTSSEPVLNVEKEVGVKPAYLEKNNLLNKDKNSIRGIVRRTLRFLMNKDHSDFNDPTRYTKSRTTQIRISEMINRQKYKMVKRVDFESFCNNKYVYYGFHKQPESSIDVIGRYYEDQYKVIQAIRLFLPANYTLVLKEHTNAIGDRTLEFYKRCLSLENVVLCDEHCDSEKIIESSQGVFTISGTMGLEASYKGIPSFTFANCYFNGFGTCLKICMEDFRSCANYQELVDKIKNNRKIEEMLELISNSSYPGIIGDYVHTDGVDSDENIHNLTKAFLSVI